MDEELKPEEAVNETASKLSRGVSKVSNGFKKATKAIGSAFKALANPLVLKAIAIGGIALLVVIIFVAIIGVVASYAQKIADCFNFVTGIFSSPYGMTGDDIYGARVIYVDNSLEQEEFSKIHLEFTFNLFTQINESEQIENSTLDLSAGQESQIVVDSCNAYLNKIVASYVENWENSTIATCGTKIDHFGLKENEITITLNSIAESIATNIMVKEPNTALSVVTSVFENNFDYMKNVSDKIIVKDHLATEKEGVKDLAKQNYLAYIFMPKKDLKIKETSFAVVTDEGKTCTVELGSFTNGVFSSLYAPATVDDTWASGEEIDKMYECDKLNYVATKFTAINENDLEYLTGGKSVFSLLKEQTFATYFNGAESYTAGSIVSLVKDSNFVALKTTATDPFSLVEFSSEIS